MPPVRPVARQFPNCAFFSSALIAQTFFSRFAPLHHLTTSLSNTSDHNHGSCYAPSLVDPEGLPEGVLVRLQKRRIHSCEVLLVQVPGTVFRTAICSLTSSIDRATWPQTLKERFAELLPEKIEQIKALRKYDSLQLALIYPGVVSLTRPSR